MPDATFDTTDPAVRARLVEYITLEQEEADEWRAIQDAGTGPLVAIAPSGIDACQALIGKYMTLLAEGER